MIRDVIANQQSALKIGASFAQRLRSRPQSPWIVHNLSCLSIVPLHSRRNPGRRLVGELKDLVNRGNERSWSRNPKFGKLCWKGNQWNRDLGNQA